LYQIIGELRGLKRRKAGKGSKRFSWTITEDVALLSAASNSAQLIKIKDAAGLLASLDSVKARIKYLKVNTECTSRFLNETCPGQGGQKTNGGNMDRPKDVGSSNLQRDLMGALDWDESDTFYAALALQVINLLVWSLQIRGDTPQIFACIRS
jgi:hypothetical protein